MIHTKMDMALATTRYNTSIASLHQLAWSTSSLQLSTYPPDCFDCPWTSIQICAHLLRKMRTSALTMMLSTSSGRDPVSATPNAHRPKRPRHETGLLCVLSCRLHLSWWPFYILRSQAFGRILISATNMSSMSLMSPMYLLNV